MGTIYLLKQVSLLVSVVLEPRAFQIRESHDMASSFSKVQTHPFMNAILYNNSLEWHCSHHFPPLLQWPRLEAYKTYHYGFEFLILTYLIGCFRNTKSLFSDKLYIYLPYQKLFQIYSVFLSIRNGVQDFVDA